MSWVPPPGAWLALRVCSVDSRPDAVPVVLRALPSVPEAGGEALCCVLAGLVPAGCGSGELPRWRPDAVRFLSALRGRDLRGQVAEVLPSPRLLVLLNVPTMARRMQDLGLASRVPEGLFRSLLESYLLSHAPEPLGADYFYPQLQSGVTEPVVVTHVCYPLRVHCQLRELAQEIRLLSDSMAQAYSGAPGTADHAWPGALDDSPDDSSDESPDKPGAPCAACGPDGRWHRALLLATPQTRRGAQVLLVDLGRQELASRARLRPLLPEYFRMPVVTYPCALLGLWDGGRGWSRAQVRKLRALLLGRALNAKIEFYCAFEHVYYVTLYGHDGINLNRLFGTQTCCLAEKFLQSSGGEEEEEEGEEVDGEEEEEDPGGQAGDTDAALTGLRSIRLKPSAFYDAQVEFVASPSEFWIRLKKHHGPFSRLARRMCSFYSLASKREGVILKPEREDLCCVKWKDNGYYRAIVTKLGDRSVEVFLADRGNTEQVDWGDLRMLLPQFRRLPALALRCTLADVWPLGTAWSQEAVSFFKRTVLHKELVIHTLDKRAQQYVIEILDESRTGEENIGKVIAQAGYAKYQEFEPTEGMAAHAHSLGHSSNHFIAENDKVSSAMKVEEQISERDKAQSVSEALVHTAIVTNISTGGVGQEKENVASVFSSLTPLDFLTMKPGSSSKELEVGSTVKVKVFHVENPGDFWCQLARNPQEFRALMCDIEDYCKTTAAPYQGASPACLAKRAASGKWSRALVTGALSSERVRVHFVDYGDTGVVSVKDIYSASDEFLKVTALAFRCSLYNLIQPTGENPFVWDEKATQVFTEFVHNAVQNCLELNCMICAVVSVHNEQFNVVDLLTPFQSACHVLVEKRLARPVKPQKPLESSVQLHSYYYSAHDIKIGSEESVYITHVDDPCTFYCQLAKNVDIFKHLSCHISQLIKVLPSVQTSPLTPGSLCLAKYTDGNWYRGLVIEQEPTKVFFVDFGNVYVTSDNLLPIPHDAYEVLLLPMQAVKCSLSDIPDQMPEEATTWFQETVLDKSMKALVVAKDPNGRLIIELYDDCSQINANINEKLGLLDYKTTRGKEKESETFLSTTETLKENNENVQFSPMEHLSKSAENQSHTLEILGESFKPKIGSPGNKLKHLQNSTVTNSVAHHQGSMENKNNQVFLPTREKKEDIFDDPPLKATKLEATLAAKIGDSHNEDLPLKFYAFPQKTLRPGFKTTVYVSHINDLSDFYVQLTEDEAEINHLSEKLNDVKTRPQHYAGPLQKGDVICAIFSEDSLWYRAVVKEQQPGSLLSVQFIDYGNVDVIHTDNIGRLDLVNARVPQLCIHCSLRGLWVPDIVKCKEVMHYFSQRTDEAQIRCEFVKFQEKWEVILADEHGIIAEDMISRYTFRREPQICPSTQIIKGDYAKSANKSDIDTTVLLNWHKPQMKTVRAYAMVVDGPEYFWCQFADTEKLEYLEVGVQTATKQTIHWRDSVRCPHVGEPCLVKYREDGHYYRALITNIHEDHLLSVRLIDFGNVEDCVDPKTVLNIPPELLSIPMQAFPCCLSGFNISEGSCPQQGNDYFYEIVTEDVLEITILEIKRDVCDVPLAIVDLRSKGESINEKMKKYSKISTAKMFLPYEKDGSEIKGGFGHPQPDVGFKKPSYKVVQDKALCVERQAEEHSERIPKYLNIVETKPSRFCDPGTDNIFEAFENPYEGGTGSVLESTKECYLGDQAVFDDAFLITEFSTLLPHAGEMAESLELNSFEVPLSPDEDLKEFLEVESLQLQHSPVREEHKEDLSLEPPMTPLSGGRDTKATLGPFPLRLPHSCESETHPVVELPAAPLSPEDIVGPSPVLVDEKAQKSECTEGAREAGCGDPVDNHLRVPLHLHGETCDPAVHTEMSLFEEKLQEYKNRDAISSLIPSLPEEELRDGRKQNHASPDNGLASQQQNTYTLEGFTVGSKCVVWSSLRNTWSKCEILEIAEQGTKVLNLSNGTEELVNPKDVWNGIPKLEKSPSEASFQTFGKDLYLLSLDDTTSKEEGSGGEPRFC
ncbi:tudor domain-containing protein 6 isoform X2 [Heterocephalus glaber]|uniref:Tudor domain-containing protein 6 isoform X2 n=1 Tax=Heterocephalus glaber TaxID=10181 RepID=A0AAX6T1Z5_HETGA|nr:tudor domain-containing protein 6 isoform X2 [Heterocephalus glaber]